MRWGQKREKKKRKKKGIKAPTSHRKGESIFEKRRRFNFQILCESIFSLFIHFSALSKNHFERLLKFIWDHPLTWPYAWHEYAFFYPPYKLHISSFSW
jgi:hypothetical protein